MSGPRDLRPTFDWNVLTVGETFGPLRFDLTADVVARYRAAVDDDELEQLGDRPVAPPAILTLPALALIDAKYAPRPGGIHARQEFDFCAPLYIGSVLTLVGTLAMMQLKRGRRYFTVESNAIDEVGTEVMRSRTTGVYPSDEGGPAHA